MRAGVNVSAFYPTLERVVTEYADNSIAAILRMLADRGVIVGSNLWVKYEGSTLEVGDDGPGRHVFDSRCPLVVFFSPLCCF